MSSPKRRPRPVTVRQPWGEEYVCCGGHPDHGHVGCCGA
jgi:hypothetical protein